jgi:probable F420-dependent oxidoreductase
VKLGLTIFPTDSSIAPAELAAAAEERGFESLWFPEHSHIPASRRTPFPGGGELPKQYYDVMEPFVALATAAMATRTLRVATGVCLVPQRDPIQTAKSVATLDRLSGGRFLFGVGAGWNAEEMENHGTRFETRAALMRERIEAMKEIWTRSRAEYHGTYVDFEPLMAWPKPLQKPHPPIHVGGGWPHAARRAIRYGDGWAPIHGFGDLAGKLPEFRSRARDAGRDPAGLEITIFGLPPQPAAIEPYRTAGAARGVFILPAAPREEVLPLLDRYAGVARELAG